ncbi:hypothetical protein B0T10DRAFT_121961 [Thelonectria olida]|uniref:DUF1765-domain-containing protein n=1 Tax=Thelonectria olida TaxID=1576542 RepID=A0A9P8WGA7_9HYPO|nr:hypothetical protein B0T10DRAFT_121961 [Thelonectria olida]
MRGPTVIMAPAVETSSSFSRSRSTPDLLSLSGLDTPPPSLSLNLPDFDVPSFNSDFTLDTSVFLSTTKPDPNVPASVVRTQEVTDENAQTKSQSKNRPKHARNRTGSLVERPRWLPNTVNGDPVKEDLPRPTTSAGDMRFAGASPGKDELKPLPKNLSTGSFASFARSWKTSRSPSPMGKPDAPKENKEDKAGRTRADSSTSSVKLTKTRKRPGLTVEQADTNKSTESLKPASKGFRASNFLTKKKQKPAVLAKLNTNTVQVVVGGSDNSCASSATSLVPPASISTDGRNSQSTPIDTTTTKSITDESSIEMPQPQTRDALWSSFKTLDLDFKGFLAKSTAQRMSQISSQVFPFLRSTMNHESIKKLYPEDVDRRATILNKWWIAILEMLEGQTPQPLPGVDRQILYDAATWMMMRPEWRQNTSYFQPLASRSPGERVRARSNSTGSSMTSSQAAFLEESSEHNVRTMFVSNLVRQMAFVVEKMSLRHAPMGLVNFAGRACAYAFFFAPGVSDILIRLWGLSPELIRRVADEMGLPRKNRGESEDIVALFPPSLSTFGWSTPKSMWDNLKRVPKLPMLVSRIPWTGPWVSRWKGRDTDLFFIFCKYFHILSEQFMPASLPLIEKARSPAFALVHAQLLFVLDTTIHRQTAIDGYAQPLVDSINGPDTALTLALPPSNVMKGMSENRLVMLLKDFLSDDTEEVAGARHTFAESFAALMKASTRKTSQFNHSACFTLCDFLEEVLVLYSEFEDPARTKTYLDWTFWIDVCRKVMGTYNTMSEVRMMSLVFGIWDAIAKDPQRKWTLCKDWLLTEETFNEFFNHWCPMVRAYYHRLICWRMCRDTGRHEEVDQRIFLLVARRLKTNWAHYLYLKHTAEEEERPPPSTAPVLPAPGKRFMIIRQEVNTSQTGLFMGFDGTKSPSTESPPGNTNGDLPKTDAKKRWSLLGKVLSLSGGTNNPDDWEDDLQVARRETAEGRKTIVVKGGRFSEESDNPVYDEPKFVFKFILAWQNQAAPFRDRFLTRPRLPAPAQARIAPPSSKNSPQVPSEGFTPPTRKFSGSPQLAGLINGARNASPMSSPVDELPRRLSLGLHQANSRPELSASELSLSDLAEGRSNPASRKPSPAPSTPVGEMSWGADRWDDGVTEPIKPAGLYVKNVVYAGRALAEWAQVIFECNNFVERRRDEGVTNLWDMEIPILGVEGFRKIGG